MTPPEILTPTRRALLGAAGAFLALPAFGARGLAATPGDGRLTFGVFRNGVRIGDQEMTFARSGGVMTVTSHAVMAVKMGPVPVFRYDHQSQERWRDGRFDGLDTQTSSNGKRDRVTARRGDAGVSIETGTGTSSAAADAVPFSHWNSATFGKPMFNPQTGEILKVSAGKGSAADAPGDARATSRWVVRGTASIDDWYDAGDIWVALRGVLKDKSVMEYRRT